MDNDNSFCGIVQQIVYFCFALVIMIVIVFASPKKKEDDKNQQLKENMDPKGILNGAFFGSQCHSIFYFFLFQLFKILILL